MCLIRGCDLYPSLLRDMGQYEVPLSRSLLDFGIGYYASQLYGWYYVVVRTVLNMLVRNASTRAGFIQVSEKSLNFELGH